MLEYVLLSDINNDVGNFLTESSVFVLDNKFAEVVHESNL